jgi:hypothetical protein
MFLKKSKTKGKTYYQLFDDTGFVAHIGTAEKILEMKKFYEEAHTQSPNGIIKTDQPN